MRLNEEPKDYFIEQMGLFTQAEGLPRISGRIFGLMILEGGAFSFSELAERLDVSRGSISTNTRLLVSIGLIEKTAKPGERQDYFQVPENPYINLLAGIRSRMQKAQGFVEETKKHFPDKECQKRLSELEGFYDTMSKTYESIIKNAEGA